MRIQVNLDAVQNVKRYIETVQKNLYNNHVMFTHEVEQNLVQWKDDNVMKFLAIYGNATSQLQSLLNELSKVSDFCDEIIRMIIEYNS